MKSLVIKHTTDYSKFIADKANRKVRPNKLLRDSMQRHGWLPEFPAFVVEDGNLLRIKDGQHRFEYAKALKLPIFYKVGEENSLGIAELNNTQRRWSLKDYVTSFANQGNQDYKSLLFFSEDSNLLLYSSAMLLSARRGPQQVSDSIKCGKFKVTSQNHAKNVMTVLRAASAFVSWWRNTYFVTAVHQVMFYADADTATLCKKIRAHPGKLVLQPTVEGFVDMLHCVYNEQTRNAYRVDINFKVDQGIRESKSKACK